MAYKDPRPPEGSIATVVKPDGSSVTGRVIYWRNHDLWGYSVWDVTDRGATKLATCYEDHPWVPGSST